MRRRRFAPLVVATLRLSAVAIMLLAWLAISNHCALAAALAGGSRAACCAKKMPLPKPAAEMVCCKVLKAVDASSEGFQPRVTVVGELDLRELLSIRTTPGPRQACSLAHAPPPVFLFPPWQLQRGPHSLAPPSA